MIYYLIDIHSSTSLTNLGIIYSHLQWAFNKLCLPGGAWSQVKLHRCRGRNAGRRFRGRVFGDVEGVGFATSTRRAAAGLEFSGAVCVAAQCGA